MNRYVVFTDTPISSEGYGVFNIRRGTTSSGGPGLDFRRAVAVCRDPEMAQLIADLLNKDAAP